MEPPARQLLRLYRQTTVVFLAGQLTVFRNIKYFRKFMDVTYRRQNGTIEHTVDLFTNPNHMFVESGASLYHTFRALNFHAHLRPE